MDFDRTGSYHTKKYQMDRSDDAACSSLFLASGESHAETTGGKAQTLLAASGDYPADCESDGLFVSFRTRHVILCGGHGGIYVAAALGHSGAFGSCVDGMHQVIFLCTLSDGYSGGDAHRHSVGNIGLCRGMPMEEEMGETEKGMLEVRGIQKTYRRNPVLTDVNLIVPDGECVGLAGANGVGKSTLLKILVGGLAADGGEIFFHGEPVGAKQLSEKVGYVPQENPLFEDLTAKDNLELWFRGDKKRIEKEFCDGLLEKFGIAEFYDKRVSRLSGGMKKRLSICCALASDPEILVLDEPGAALDLLAKQAILDVIRDFTKEGKSVIITSHEIPELMMCDRLYGMKNGITTLWEKEINSLDLQRWMEED